MMAGHSDVGKNRLVQALGSGYYEKGFRVRTTICTNLLDKVPRALAEQSLPQRVGYWAWGDLLVIDERGFERIVRSDCAQAAKGPGNIVKRCDRDPLHETVENRKSDRNVSFQVQRN